MDIKETVKNVKSEVEEKIKDIDIKEVAEKVKDGGVKGLDEVREKATEVIGKISGKKDNK